MIMTTIVILFLRYLPKLQREAPRIAAEMASWTMVTHTRSKNSQSIKVEKGKKPGLKFKYKCGHWDYIGREISQEEEVCDKCK